MEKTMMQKLLEAGVSADIVLKLHMEEAGPEPEVPQDPEPEAPAAPEQKEQAAPAAPPAPAEQKTDQVLAAIEKLTGIIQAGNIRKTYRTDPPMTTDDILGTILKGDDYGEEE